MDHVHLRRADKLRGKKIVGVMVDVCGACLLLDDAPVHQDDLGAHGHGFGLIVGNIDKGCFQPVMQFDQLRAHAYTKLCIQVGKRLVHQKYLGLFDHGANSIFS